MKSTLRKRALDEALASSQHHLERIRSQDASLARHIRRGAMRHRVAGPLGVVGLAGSLVLAALTAAAVVATPIGWIAAASAAVGGLAGLGVAASAGRRRDSATKRRQSFRLGHAGRALEVDALLMRLAAVRSALARDYARFEERVLAQVDPRKHAANASLLQSLRARQLDHVRRLDALRDQGLALRDRLVEADIAARVDSRLVQLEDSREAYRDRAARAVFERDDTRQELDRLSAETSALEALELEFADSGTD